MSAVGASLRARPLRSKVGRRLLVLCLVAVALACAYVFWFRDSSLVGVKTVRVEGVGGSSTAATELRQALEAAGLEMTTLHLREDLLREVAADYPLVRSVDAEADFPNGLTVRVSERRPVALIGSGEEAVAVADDGVILRGVPLERVELPSLPLQEAPRRERLRGSALEQALILGAAPAALLEQAETSYEGELGVAVTMQNGVELRFGGPSQARAKWLAAAAVLADPVLTALDYVDLTSPRRPAVGGEGHYLPAVP